MGWVARLDVRAGAHEAAIDLIQELQAMPAGHTLSQALLKVDPIWDPLRSEPKFQTLLSKPDLVITRDATRG
jgi:serine/threonine-protein kinase